MQQMTPEQFCHLSLHILLPLLGGITSSALTASEQKGWCVRQRAMGMSAAGHEGLHACKCSC